MTRRRIPRPRLRCPVCAGAPRLPADLRRELRCQSGARLRVALVLARPPLPAPTRARPRAGAHGSGAIPAR